MMANETPDMNKLQQDAIRRVQEMQNRARRAAGLGAAGAAKPDAQSAAGPAPQRAQERGSATHAAPAAVEKAGIERPSTVWDSLLKDRERTLILVLILILSSEKADTSLILALMYLAGPE